MAVHKGKLSQTWPPTPANPAADAFIILVSFIGIFFALYQFSLVQRVKLVDSSNGSGNGAPLLTSLGIDTTKLMGIYEAIRVGADSFLRAEYTICMYFIGAFGIVVLILTSYIEEKWHFDEGALTAVAFVAGGLTSIISGLIGMKVAVYANARTAGGSARTAPPGWTRRSTAPSAPAPSWASRSAALSLILYSFSLFAFPLLEATRRLRERQLMECVAGFGLGGSSIALFGRVGGGIYTKAADVGADLAGKVSRTHPRGRPAQPGTIADNVGDNVGDVAGMGSDLFGSFGEATCAALVVGASLAPISPPVGRAHVPADHLRRAASSSAS